MSKGCVKVSRPDGTSYTVPIGVSFTLRPGEAVTGRAQCDETDNSKPSGPLSPQRTVNALLEEMREVVGSGTGDVIKHLISPIAKLLGKTHCTSCEATRIIMNAFGKLKTQMGTIEAAKTITELSVQAKGGDHAGALEKLKGLLNG